jgi:hypothetical protein
LAVSTTALHFDRNDLPCMPLEMNATAIMKSVPQLLEPNGTLYHFEGELSGYSPDTKREETVSDSDIVFASNSFLIT